MQHITQKQSFQAFITNIQSCFEQQLSRQERAARFREKTRLLDATALWEIFEWYYKHTDAAVGVLEECFVLDTSNETLYQSLLIAYTSCDLLRFHVECSGDRTVAGFDLPFASRDKYMTLSQWQGMMARCNELCKRQRAVEKALHDRGIRIDPGIANGMSQHRPLM